MTTTEANKSVNHRRFGSLLVLLMIGIAFRLIGITASSLWFDEVFSRNVAVQTSLSSIIYDGVAGDVHPPLYFVLLYLWVHLTGDSVLALRTFSALLSVLTLPAIYHLARRLFDTRTGWVALILTSLSPLQVYYGQEARQYMLSVLCATWIGIGLIDLIHRRRFGMVVYVVAAVAGLYTHYFIALLLVSLHVWLIVYHSTRQQWQRWLLADLVIAICFLPQVAIFLGQTQTVLNGFWIAPPSPFAPLATLAFLLLGSVLPVKVAYLALVVISCLLVVGYLEIRRSPVKARTGWWLAAIAVLLSLLMALIVSFIRSPIYLDRSFALLSPFMIVMLASGITYTRRPSLTPILATLLVAIFVGSDIYHSLTSDPAKLPYQKVAEQILAQSDALLVPVIHLHDSSYLPMTYYAPELDQKLLNLGATSWLFPKTWQIFGVQRWTQTQLIDWWNSYQGTVRIVITNQIDTATFDMFNKLKLTACQVSDIAYPDRSSPQIVVYTLTRGTCIAQNFYVP